MKQRILDLRGEEPLLDIVSYGRGGPRSLTHLQLQQISRTVRRVPEVMVRVSGGARTLAGVERHVRYIGRDGKLPVESDTGERIGGKGFESDLVLDWNLDVEAHRRQHARAIRAGRRPPRLVHNVFFSMPPGTPPEKVLKAVRRLAWEEFGTTHRHAMVLHTDERHPHVHVVIKAMSEQGERLYIRPPTLRRWRALFAANLRELGVAANATDRAVRGQPKTPKSGIYRAAQRGESRFLNDLARRSNAAGRGESRADGQGDAGLVEGRKIILRGWRSLMDRLRGEGHGHLADAAERFVARMPPPQTTQEFVLTRSGHMTRTRQVEPPPLTLFQRASGLAGFLSAIEHAEYGADFRFHLVVHSVGEALGQQPVELHHLHMYAGIELQ